MVDRNVGGRVVSKSEAGTQASQEIERREAAERSGGSGYNGGNGGCFPSGTLVSTPSGTRDITAIRSGELVSAVDTRTGIVISRQVLKVRRYSSRRIWNVTFEDGHQVRTTSVHSFRVGNDWKIASRIRPGDEIFTYSSQGAIQRKVVARSQQTNEVEDVYNLIVDGEFTFVAAGALVHSFTHFRQVRMLLWRVFTSGLGQFNFSPARAVACSLVTGTTD
jgi:hypothetical protein